MLTWLVCAVVALAAVLTLLPLSRSEQWWVRLWDFPRLQIAVGAILGAALALGLPLEPVALAWPVAGVALACAAYQAIWILPYTPLWKRQVRRSGGADDAPRLRILVCNVLMTNRDSSRLLAQIRANRPDVVVTLETDAWWQQELDALADDYPNAQRCPLPNLYGMHVYSRLPLLDGRTQFLIDPAIPSMHMLVELPTGDRVRLHCLHPMPPSPTEKDESTERDAELVVVGRSVARASLPVIVTGDLNDVAWSRTTRLFLKVSGLLDPRRGRGMYSTFHAGNPLVRWPLDHVFHSNDFLLSFIQRLPAMGSDHFPILFELVLSPRAGAAQHSLDGDSADQAEAQEKVEDADAEDVHVHAPGEPKVAGR